SLQKQRAGAEEHLKELNDAEADAKKRITQAEERAKEKEDERSERCAELEKQAEALQKEIAGREAELAETKKILADEKAARERVEAAQKEHAELTQKVTDAQAALKETEKRSLGHQAQFDILSSSVSEKQSEYDDLTREHGELEASVAQLTLDVA